MLDVMWISALEAIEVVQRDFSLLFSPVWWSTHWVAIWNVIVIDVVLAGDNAIVVGLAASRVAPEMRAKVIFFGIAGAVVLRILFAAVTTQLLQIVGLTLAGGILLLWVCWKMYREVVTGGAAEALAEVEEGLESTVRNGAYLGTGAAIFNIVLADVSMSLDNVLAVAGAAKGETLVLVIGLAVAIVLMAIASHFIARLLAHYPWITWIGLIIILYIAIEMIYLGAHQVSCVAYATGCSETLYTTIRDWLTGPIAGPSR